MEKKKIDTKAILERSRKAKQKNTNLDKVVKKAKNNDKFRRVNFNG